MNRDELRTKLRQLGYGEQISLEELETALRSPELQSDPEDSPHEASFRVLGAIDDRTTAAGNRGSDGPLARTRPTEPGVERPVVERIDRPERQPPPEPSFEEQLLGQLVDKVGVIDSQIRQIAAPGGELDRALNQLLGGEQTQHHGPASDRDSLRRELEEFVRKLL